MFKDLQTVLLVGMLEVYTADLRFCLAEGGVIEDFPPIDVFKMIMEETQKDTHLVYHFATSQKTKPLLFKIAKQLQSGDFEPACSGKRFSALRSLLRLSMKLSAAV